MRYVDLTSGDGPAHQQTLSSAQVELAAFSVAVIALAFKFVDAQCSDYAA
jgi:hypothetical protein